MRGEEHYFSKKLYREKTILEIKRKISLLGVSTKLDVYSFLNLRFLGMILIFLLFLVSSKIGFILAPLFTYLFCRGITYFLLDKRIKDRQVALETEALSFFEILTLSLETGRNLSEALNVTVHSSLDGQLVLEFREVLREVDYGKSLTEAMNDIQSSIPSDTINNAVLNIIQSSIFGNNIEESLNNQLDFLRDKHLMEVKSEIGKLPTKISIISVVFFIPIILMVILAPVLVDLIMK